jgi:hypothetical protein
MNAQRAAALVLVALLLAPAGCAEMSKSLGALSGAAAGGPLDEGTIGAGLKEALRVGAERAVGRVSKLDGFLADELIRIAVPDELETMTSALRKVGMGRQVDELETSMNRAAEKASAEATAVFWEAVQGLTIDDARAVLSGGKHAATKLLRARTTTSLETRIHPIVKRKMDEVGLSRLYGDLAARYDALPFGQKPAIRLDDYVTAETLDGLFTVLAQEEERIRADPAARTTELLRRVFQ